MIRHLYVGASLAFAVIAAVESGTTHIGWHRALYMLTAIIWFAMAAQEWSRLTREGVAE